MGMVEESDVDYWSLISVTPCQLGSLAGVRRNRRVSINIVKLLTMLNNNLFLFSSKLPKMESKKPKSE